MTESSAPMPPHDVQTTLNFIEEQPDGSHLTPIYVGKPSSYIRPTTAIPVVFHDVSGREQYYTLDNNGFQFHHHTSQTKDLCEIDNDQIKRLYYPEIDKLIKDVTGASRTYVFDHTIHRAARDFQGSSPQARGPIQRVHIDQTDAAAKKRVEYYLGDEASELLKYRYQIINVWRPLKPILRDPLAVADASTVSDDDLVPIKVIYPDKVGETCLVKPNPRIRWYYRDRQTPDMVTLFKCFESKTDGRARRVPHSAFAIPGTEEEEARESIEVRALVFYSTNEE
ncbi:uncharacterized protein KD926_000760 [Aspergillus affinis]|uniref:uncharacterized protein n=1 Tax=Aspergillus affinis TaxID=1070780 RepID=UPI0022FF08BC|nr:uncharacterized protein KD926_000760 [Aspergillus affinis]KAI9037187.1 hypothetical protein KD926_000760 [Aspergillus affinis]